MNAERLLALYEKVAEAPDAIARLRRFVLDLAVRGKLVNAEIKWRSCTLGEVGQWGSGGTPTRTNPDYYGGNIPWLVIGDLNDGVVTEAATHITQAGLDNSSAKLIERGTVMIAMYGSIGKLGIAGIQCATNQAIAHCVPDQKMVSTNYFLVLLRSLGEEFLSKGQGVAQQNISQKILKSWPVQLPPIAEQLRIVAKVEELMALLDRLEAARKEREATRDRLTAGSLNRLTAPDTTPEVFPAHARFALGALPALTARRDQIKSLRQTILNLAVRGKLVDQDPNDEPASELLKRIAKERAARLDADYPNPSEAKAQRKKQAQQRLPEDLTELPPGWSWATLQQCSLLVIDCKNKTAPYSAAGIKLVRTTNVRDGALNSMDQKFVSKAIYEAWSLRAKPEPGDILITREAPMGEVCIIPEGERICLGQRMMLTRLVPRTIDMRFMLYSLRDPGLMDRIQDEPLGMTVQHLRVGGVETLLVPLPPLAEQQRIVAKVDELMALCGRLEASLATADTKKQRLLEALLRETLEPTLKEAA